MTDSSESPSLEPTVVKQEDRAATLKREKSDLLDDVAFLMRDAWGLHEARVVMNRVGNISGRESIQPITRQAAMIVDIEYEKSTKAVYQKLRKVYEIDLELAMLSSRHLNK